MDDQPPIPLHWLLDYELHAAMRYRRYVSMILIATRRDPQKLQPVVRGILRESDELFPEAGTLAVLMTETRQNDALRVVRRLSQACTGQFPVYFSVVSYPQDGHASAALLQRARRRLKVATEGEIGTVVASG